MATQLDRKMNLPLSRDTHAALLAEANLLGLPATRLARSIIDEWLHQRQRERVADEIAEFAARYGGTDLDLDDQLETGAADQLGELP